MPTTVAYSNVLCEPPAASLPTYYGRNRQGTLKSADVVSETTCADICQRNNEVALEDAQEVFSGKGRDLESKSALAARLALQESIYGELDMVPKEEGPQGAGGIEDAGEAAAVACVPPKMIDVELRREKEWENYQRSHRSVHSAMQDKSVSQLVGNTESSQQTANLPRAFIDISNGDDPLGRMVIELFSAECPAAVSNFQALLTGSAGFDMTRGGVRLDYLGSPAHYMKKGDSMSIGLLGGQSISSTGTPCRDENFRHKHQQRGTVSMISAGPNGIGSAFSITFGPAPRLDFVQQIVGKVVDGLAVLDQIESLQDVVVPHPSNDSRTQKPPTIHITFCGMLSGERPGGRQLLEAFTSTPEGREVALAWANQTGPLVWGGSTMKKAAAFKSNITGLDCIARMVPATAPTHPTFGEGVVDVSDVDGSSIDHRQLTGNDGESGGENESGGWDQEGGTEASGEDYFDDGEEEEEE